ncbi:FluC/FEX family fluoride channel [Corynebacterium pseudotuberculosis]|uniref:FluC/FEX family fluoride channel n=1 Tax=Corynebacterium pseudotuberculosis TaxID=1719 RepID=UPI0002660FF9|nr:CrcB family protein [Corynebacterium pseudotuberculosis]AFM07993.1 CrcB family protein [Corynebacterium pseudotuberculosis Cp162]APG82394.1 Protein crcB 2 [Corynebacterium pseudotuberculosis]WFP66815.1 CrcB family protein [Corynebacterium pseudotuberculosis]
MTLYALGAVLLGGFCGGVCRLWLGALGPYRGTLVANVAACIALAWVWKNDPSQEIILYTGTGLAGALSTWSTLAKELGTDIIQGRWLAALGYLAITCVLGIGSALLILHV